MEIIQEQITLQVQVIQIFEINTNSHLKIYYQNIRSLKNKIQDFKVNVAASDFFDIICLVETWLDDSVSDLELSLKDYDFIRSDRNFTKSGKSRAGGLLIYFKKSINFKLLTPMIIMIENCCCEIYC